MKSENVSGTKKGFVFAVLSLCSMSLIGCATKYPTTELDRELALKLADRPSVIVAPSAPPTVINVNNFSGGGGAASHGDSYQSATTRDYCVDSPLYDVNGKLVKTVKNCF